MVENVLKRVFYKNNNKKKQRQKIPYLWPKNWLIFYQNFQNFSIFFFSLHFFRAKYLTEQDEISST